MSNTIPVSLSVVRACFDHTKGRVAYLYGSKPALGSDSASFHTADCSGWVRWCLDRAGLTIPDGSATQNTWIASHGFRKLAQFSDVQYAKDDPTRLFIAFKHQDCGIGHVALYWKGHSLECRGHAGVSSRPWEAMQSYMVDCYELTPLIP